MIQRRAARYVSNRYRNTSSVSLMLGALQWESLESRRTKIQLTLLFKIINEMVDIRTDDYLIPSAGSTRRSHSKMLRQISTRTDSYKFSFFPRTIPVWNSLPASVAEAPSLVSFRKGLSPLSFLAMLGAQLPINPSCGICAVGDIKALSPHGRQSGPYLLGQKQLGKLSSFYLSICMSLLFPLVLYLIMISH